MLCHLVAVAWGFSCLVCLEGSKLPLLIDEDRHHLDNNRVVARYKRDVSETQLNTGDEVTAGGSTEEPVFDHFEDDKKNNESREANVATDEKSETNANILSTLDFSNYSYYLTEQRNPQLHEIPAIILIRIQELKKSVKDYLENEESIKNISSVSLIEDVSPKENYTSDDDTSTKISLSDDNVELETNPISDDTVELETNPISDDNVELETNPISDDNVELETNPISDDNVELETNPISDDNVEQETNPISDLDVNLSHKVEDYNIEEKESFKRLHEYFISNRQWKADDIETEYNPDEFKDDGLNPMFDPLFMYKHPLSYLTDRPTVDTEEQQGIIESQDSPVPLDEPLSENNNPVAKQVDPKDNVKLSIPDVETPDDAETISVALLQTDDEVLRSERNLQDGLPASDFGITDLDNQPHQDQIDTSEIHSADELRSPDTDIVPVELPQSEEGPSADKLSASDDTIVDPKNQPYHDGIDSAEIKSSDEISSSAEISGGTDSAEPSKGESS